MTALRIHYRPTGRSLPACCLGPVPRVTDDAGRVTCARCRAMILSGHERTRPLPQTRRSA